MSEALMCTLIDAGTYSRCGSLAGGIVFMAIAVIPMCHVLQHQPAHKHSNLERLTHEKN